MGAGREWGKDIFAGLLILYMVSRAALPEQLLLLGSGALQNPAFWEGNPLEKEVLCRGMAGLRAAPIKELLFWDVLLLLFSMNLFARLALPRQYMLLCSGVLGKRLLYEESYDALEGEGGRFILYESRNREKVGLLCISKRYFLLWRRYSVYERKEVDSAKGTAFSRTNDASRREGRRGYPLARKLPYREGQAVFAGWYPSCPEGLAGQAVLRYVCCGRVSKRQAPEWFRELGQGDFRYFREEGECIYFYVDLPGRPGWQEGGMA